MRDSLKTILAELQDMLDEVYDWEESDIRTEVIVALEDIQSDLEDTLRLLK